jgi:hypothetical protein
LGGELRDLFREVVEVGPSLGRSTSACEDRELVLEFIYVEPQPCKLRVDVT